MTLIDVRCTLKGVRENADVFAVAFAQKPSAPSLVRDFVRTRAFAGYAGVSRMFEGGSEGAFEGLLSRVVVSVSDPAVSAVDPAAERFVYCAARDGANKSLWTVSLMGSTRGLIFYKGDQPWVVGDEGKIRLGASGDPNGLAFDIHPDTTVHSSEEGFVALVEGGDTDTSLRHRSFETYLDPFLADSVDFAYKIYRNAEGLYALGNPFAEYTYYLGLNGEDQVFLSRSPVFWRCNKLIDSEFVTVFQP